jgi:hypothetical protein
MISPPRRAILSSVNSSNRGEKLRFRLAVLSAAATLFLTEGAEAQDWDDWTGGAGLFFGYTFGEPRGFNWGVEAFSTRLFTGTEVCSSDARSGVGPLVQFAATGLGAPRLTIAGHGGGELIRLEAAFSAELGGTYRFGRYSGFGVHVGAVPEVAIFNAYVRGQALLGEVALGGGARFLPTYGALRQCGIGRPWRDEQGAVAHARALDGLGQTLRRTGARRERAGLEWQRDALLEAASVPAFLNLARDLLAANAPLDLVERALDSARDELGHASLCSALASHYLGKRVHPVLPEVAERPPLLGTHALARLAIESYWDGCVSEAGAARIAAQAARTSKDPLSRRAQDVIARDELKHSELAFDIVEWVLSQRDPAVWKALHDALDAPGEDPMDSSPGVEELGRVSGRNARDAHCAARMDARWRLGHMLAASAS